MLLDQVEQGHKIGKILICTPSNGAVDEILKRLHYGGDYGIIYSIDYITRIGSMHYKAPEDLQVYSYEKKYE